MGTAKGMHSFDSALYCTQYADPTPVPASYTDLTQTWTELMDVISINGVPMERSVTMLSHLRSPSKAAEKVPGFLDAGNVTLRLNYRKGSNSDGLVQLERLSPGGAGAPDTSPSWGRLTWAVTFPDHGVWVLCGFLKSKPVEIPEDNRVTVEIAIEISGKPTFYAFA